jgi:hypothetical protein
VRDELLLLLLRHSFHSDSGCIHIQGLPYEGLQGTLK